jgi:mannose-1-phosphate guanylyltransferase
MGYLVMNIILLSGGSGKRLWPLSNDTRSKQFLRLLKNNQGDYESMVQRVYRQIKQVDPDTRIVIATGAYQVDSIKSQLGDKVDIVVEPERRDTFPAISLAAAYFANEKKLDPEDIILVLPVDPYTEIGYFETLLHMEKAAREGVADLVLMGIKPTHPSSQYGYILPKKDADIVKEENPFSNQSLIHKVERFVEKPPETDAESLITQGAVWNGGVFAFRLHYMMDKIQSDIPEAVPDTSIYKHLLNHYSEWKKTSFDYEVVEKAPSIAMIRFDGKWKDLGNWITLTQEVKEGTMGKVTVDEDTVNSYVFNELPIPVVVLGAKDLVIASSPDGILISDLHKCTNLKTYVNDINERPMYAESLWGDYKVVDYLQYEDNIKSLTRHLTIKANQFIGYQAHRIRDEILMVVSGMGRLVIDGRIREVQRGDVVYISKGQKHSIKAYDSCDLHCIEVQIGNVLAENDIVGFQWDWDVC